jgi:hypothetical protein
MKCREGGAEIITVLGGGGEGDAAWEEKKEAQEKPIRLAAALRHRASVPSPAMPHPPAIALCCPPQLQHHSPVSCCPRWWCNRFCFAYHLVLVHGAKGAKGP